MFNASSFFVVAAVFALTLSGCSKKSEVKEGASGMVSQAPTVSARFVVLDNQQETLDNKTKLIWRRCPEGMEFRADACTGQSKRFSYDEAIKHAEAQSSSSVVWRIPSTAELKGIYEFRYVGSDMKLSIETDMEIFPSPALGPAVSYWTAGGSIGAAFLFTFYSFNDQLLYSISRDEGPALVRLVRNH
jgi:hypothetical protein